jgi:hypothetical protein
VLQYPMDGVQVCPGHPLLFRSLPSSIGGAGGAIAEVVYEYHGHDGEVGWGTPCRFGRGWGDPLLALVLMLVGIGYPRVDGEGEDASDEFSCGLCCYAKIGWAVFPPHL